MATAVQRAHTSALVGTWVFVLSDAIGFVALLSTVLALRSDSPAFSGASPDLRMGLIATALLMLTSASLIIARRVHRSWPLLSTALGSSIGFCALQYWEYKSMLGDKLVVATPAQEAFVVVTGYHVLHVAIGALILLWALARSLFGSAKAPLGPISVYWHFVDALWLIIFGALYLL